MSDLPPPAPELPVPGCTDSVSPALLGRVLRPVWQTVLFLWASPGTLLGLLAGTLALLSGGRVQRIGRTLEFSGGFATWFLRRAARGASAMTLGHVILGQTPENLAFAREHELVHVRQYELWGPLFIPAYSLCALWLRLRGRHGYWDNPFEREAYRISPCGLSPDDERIHPRPQPRSQGHS